MPTILYTSLSEIRSFNPCSQGWKDILSAHPSAGKVHTQEELDAQFPLIDCLKSNSISDVCWLLGQRKKEIQICVKFARMCADSVKHLNAAAAYAASAEAATHSAAYAAAAYAAHSAAYAADAAASAYDTKQEQIIKNTQFFHECIQAYEQEN